MKAIFIADAHIKGLDDPNQKVLCSFLESLNNIDALFILGDLFEFWTGYNKVLEYHYAPLLNQLKKLRERGIEIAYVEGNHDFAIGPFFTQILRAQVYPDSADIRLDGKRIFLAHGDIAEKSIGYKLWRRLLRSEFIKLIIKMTPPRLIWNIALRLSLMSRRNHKSGDPLDKRHLKFARDRINQGFDIVVLGHSHVPEIIEESINGKKGLYANPGDWVRQFTYLVFERGEMRLKKYRLTE